MRRTRDNFFEQQPADLLAMAAFKALPGGPSDTYGFRQAIPGTTAAMAKLAKRLGTPAEAETAVLWCKPDITGPTPHVNFMTNRGPELARVLTRVGDAGLLAFRGGGRRGDVVTLLIRLSSYRGAAAITRAHFSPLDPNSDLGRLAIEQGGHSGGPEAECSLGWMKGIQTVSVCSSRGVDVAAILRRVGNAGVVSWRALPSDGGSVFLVLDARACRPAAAVFRVTGRRSRKTSATTGAE